MQSQICEYKNTFSADDYKERNKQIVHQGQLQPQYHEISV